MVQQNPANVVKLDESKKAPVTPLPTGHVAKITEHFVQKPSWLKRNAIAVSMVVCVLIPGILGSFFFLAVASDRYVAGAGFSVRSVDATPTGGDFAGLLSGLTSTGSTTSDSYIIVKYLHSTELVKLLMKEADFINAYSRDDIDFIFRLDPDDPIEEIIEYWEGMLTVSYDNASEVIEFNVEAFTPEDSEKIASLITKYAQNLINKLSSEARNDAVKFAKREVASAELRLKFAREELRKYRANSNALDPTAVAAALAELTTGLQAQLIEQRTRLSTLRGSGSLSESSSSIRAVQNIIASLEKELAAKRAEISNSSQNQNLAGLIADFERLQIEQEFAQQAYTVTLASLERARTEADRQQRFLAVFRHPSRPDSAIYPKRFLNSILTFIVAFLAWAVGIFLFHSVRDHLR